MRRTTKQTLQVVIEELLNKKRISLVEELFDPDFCNHDPVPGYTSDRQGLRDFFLAMFYAFPNNFDVVWTHLFGEGENYAVARFVIWGIHERSFLGIEPTQKRLQLPVMSIVRGETKEGRSNQITERWSIQDNLEAMRQLGIM